MSLPQLRVFGPTLAALVAGGMLHLAAAEKAAPPRVQSIPFRVPDGFRVATVYQVPPEQGSWVCLATDPRGRLITSDQFGRLYRLTLGQAPDQPPLVSPIQSDVSGAQGLLWAFDSLYVVANRPKDRGGSGLYRLRDRDADDRFEESILLRRLDGEGEHGPHAIVPGPDGKSLYLLAGNATFLPEFSRSRVPTGWQEDMLLPHLGQTDGVFRTNRPGGWILRITPDGSDSELMAIGLRNPYDLAFNAEGDLFTFDADMEWDLGTPWYRPTRVNHVTSGADFGWRTGSSKWPDYYLDSEPAILDVGESSPTGMTFGYGARFPAKYQRALFMGDWSYGKIYALHLAPRGASYSATNEQFLAGSPLPITDLTIRPQDGALYFLTGGRGTPSTLFRVSYHGPDPTAPIDTPLRADSSLRDQRRRLEVYHGARHPDAVRTAWGYLDHADRSLRYAARVAIEHQPLSEWQTRALSEPNARARIGALTALARQGPPSVRPVLLASLGSLKWPTLDRPAQLDLLRAYALACLRLGRPTEPERKAIVAQVGVSFPTPHYELNRELGTLLVYLQAPEVVDRVLAALDRAPSQEEQMHYALCLRTLDLNQWSSAQRERYLKWFARAANLGGGVTFGEYLNGIRSQAVENLPPEKLEALAGVLKAPPPADPYLDLKQRSLVREWTVAELLPRSERPNPGADPERGRRVFSTAMCIKCHRFSRQGGMTGPDLTGVGNRFDDRTLLESILEPSKVVSDQYATVEVTTKDGDSLTGRIGDQNDDEILLKADLLNPAKIRRIKWRDIESVRPSPLSLMPTNLLDTFTEAEVLDLIAYLKSGGNPAPSR